MLEMIIVICSLSNGVESCETHKFYAVGQSVSWCGKDMTERVIPEMEKVGVKVKAFGCKDVGGRES